MHRIADRLANLVQRSQIVARIVSAKPQFAERRTLPRPATPRPQPRPRPALSATIRCCCTISQPRPSRPTVRKAACSQLSPEHPKPSISRPEAGNHRQPLIADEMEGFACSIEEFDRGYAPAFEQVAQIVERRYEIAHRLHDIRLKIAPSNDPLLGHEIDENERPLRYRSDTATTGRLSLSTTGRALISLSVRGSGHGLVAFEARQTDDEIYRWKPAQRANKVAGAYFSCFRRRCKFTR